MHDQAESAPNCKPPRVYETRISQLNLAHFEVPQRAKARQSQASHKLRLSDPFLLPQFTFFGLVRPLGVFLCALCGAVGLSAGDMSSVHVYGGDIPHALVGHEDTSCACAASSLQAPGFPHPSARASRRAFRVCGLWARSLDGARGQRAVGSVMGRELCGANELTCFSRQRCESDIGQVLTIAF